MKPVATALATVLALLLATPSPASHVDDHGAIEELASQWVERVHGRDASLASLVSREGRRHYGRLRDLALRADANELQRLPIVDQLQTIFLRIMLEPEELESMDESELLFFAVSQGFIGADLRRSDALREISVEGDRAQGRLYKFGLSDRPEQGLQYFVREDGLWRVELRGELERATEQFDAFVARSGLPAAELAFFVLEARMMRKVTRADLAPPRRGGRHEALAPKASSRVAVEPKAPAYRLVALRRAVDTETPAAVTIEDQYESMRFVLEPGDRLGANRDWQLLRVEDGSAGFATPEGERVLRLERGGPALGRRLSRPDRGMRRASLLDVAADGEQREGPMAMWRNVGLRDRPLLLQQASLLPVFEGPGGPNASIAGLEVRELTPNSFWNQLGMQEGDVVTAFNTRAIDSLDAWQALVRTAQDEVDITIDVDRGGRRFRYRTETIRPR